MDHLATPCCKGSRMTMCSSARVFFGWKVVFTAFAIATFTWGIGFYGLSVFLDELHHVHGWSVPIISAAITTHFVLSAIIVAYLDEAHHRFGIGWVTVAGVACTCAGILCWSLVTVPWQMFGAAVLTGVGWAATSGAAINAIVSPWFIRRRPIALGLALNGSSAGGVIFTQLWVFLIAKFSLFAATSLICTLMLLTLLPLIGSHLFTTPESTGTVPDGESNITRREHPTPQLRPTMPLSSLLRDRRFVTLSAAFALGLFAQLAVVIHLVGRLKEVFSVGQAAGAISLVTVCAVISRLLLGSLMGTADRRLVGLGNFALKAAGMICLAGGTNAPVLLIGCVIFGFGMGNLLLLAPLIAQKEFPPSDVRRVVALVTAGNQALFAFGPAIFGILNSVYRGYEVPFLIAASIEILAGAILLAGRTGQPTWEAA